MNMKIISLLIPNPKGICEVTIGIPWPSYLPQSRNPLQSRNYLLLLSEGQGYLLV